MKTSLEGTGSELLKEATPWKASLVSGVLLRVARNPSDWHGGMSASLDEEKPPWASTFVNTPLQRGEWVCNSEPTGRRAGAGLAWGRRHIEGFGQTIPLFSRISTD